MRWRARSSCSAYIGFDATAPSLHVGNLVPIMMLRRLQQAGHRPIVLMGGGTTKVGDPSGKDESRKLLSVEQIDANIASIRRVFERFLTFGDGPTDAIMVNNADWLDTLEYIPFLRDVGRHFTINRMLTFDSVRLRLDREQPLTFLEFNYMILQAYDFLELSRRVGCRAQFGGSDQWGNIVNGIELARRIDGTELFGVTTPLITTADGAKMGKTAQGAVWLDENLLSPYDYWQFWRNTQDARRRQVPAAVHRPAAGGHRAAGEPRRRRDQPGQDRARDRGDGTAAWPRSGACGRADGAGDLRRGRQGRDLPTLGDRRDNHRVGSAYRHWLLCFQGRSQAQDR